MPDTLRDHLAEAGNALYGERWQSPLARDLGVGDRRVREWVSGDRTTPPGIRADLERLCRERAGVLSELADRLKAV